MGSEREGTAACAAAPGPPGSRRSGRGRGLRAPFPGPGALGEGLAWQTPGRFADSSRVGDFFWCFPLLLLSVVGCPLSFFVVCMPFGGEEEGSIVAKSRLSLNCLPGPSSPGEAEGGGAKERVPEASKAS